MIGRLVEHSGGGSAVADWMLEKFGRERARWAVLVTALLVGLPLFFEVGFIILAPLAWSLAGIAPVVALFWIAARGCPERAFAVPPHPAPAAAAQLLRANLGLTILYGMAVSIPAAILGGIVYGGRIAKRMFIKFRRWRYSPKQTPLRNPLRPWAW
jgi:H+/gluconate symporter-like permease